MRQNVGAGDNLFTLLHRPDHVSSITAGYEMQLLRLDYDVTVVYDDALDLLPCYHVRGGTFHRYDVRSGTLPCCDVIVGALPCYDVIGRTLIVFLDRDVIDAASFVVLVKVTLSAERFRTFATLVRVPVNIQMI